MEISFKNHSWLNKQQSQIKLGFEFFGKPIFPNKDQFDFHEIDGMWIALKVSDKKIEMIADACGSIRTYYKMNGNTLILFDTLNENEKLEKNKAGEDYFIENGYFFGTDTIYKKIYRLPGLIFTEITNSEITESDMFFKISPPINNFKFDLNWFLKKSINNSNNQGVYLMFSGGSDSVCLANSLNELNIEFKAIFFDDSKRENDKIQAIKVAKNLNLDFEVVKLKIEDNLDCLIEKYQKFDKHYSKLHYYAAKELVIRYGEDINVINGQGSDSVLSFGPSEVSIQSFLKRIAIYSPFFLRIPINILLSIIYHKTLYLGLKNNQFYESFSSFKRYLFVNSKNNCFSYKRLVSSDGFLKSSNTAKLLSIKRLGFLMGSDNQVVINSLKSFNVDSIILPFSSLFMFRHSIYNVNRVKEIFLPKYLIKR